MLWHQAEGHATQVNFLIDNSRSVVSDNVMTDAAITMLATLVAAAEVEFTDYKLSVDRV